jgi:hypothetical protein
LDIIRAQPNQIIFVFAALISNCVHFFFKVHWKEIKIEPHQHNVSFDSRKTNTSQNFLEII